MRIGFNPNKDTLNDDSEYFHQIIVPVYIPNEEDYFKDSLLILKNCLNSLFITSHSKTYFTVVNNGSCTSVIKYLNKLLKENIIQELIHTTNIGKLNAILKGVVGQKFKFVTITDADVLFLNNWQIATYDVFRNFKKAGVVCTTPSPKSFNDKTFNILFENMFSKKLRFTKVKNPKALSDFALSIENPDFYKKCHLKNNLTIINGKYKAVVGAGHFVATYRFDVFKFLDKSYSNYRLGGDSESTILDLPIIKKGLWRLSTENNYTNHMGNVIEPWMSEIINKQVDLSDHVFDYKFEDIRESKLGFWLKNIFFARLFNQRKVRQLFLRYKGLSKKDSIDY
ncbi:MAG: glycosyltransferase family 2 protein [Algibacter sp.]